HASAYGPGGHDPAAVGAEGRSEHGPEVAVQHLRRSAGRNIPDPGVVVGARRDHETAVGAERDPRQRILVAAQDSHDGAGPRIEEPRDVVLRGRADQAPVGAEGGGVERPSTPEQAHLSQARYVPDTDRAAHRRRNETTSVAAESERASGDVAGAAHEHAAGRVPDANDALRIGGEDEPAVGRDERASHDRWVAGHPKDPAVEGEEPGPEAAPRA